MSGRLREDVLAAIALRVGNEHLRRHMLATEAIMRGLATRLGADEEAWGLAGLAHDLDVEETGDDFSSHGAVAAESIRGMGAPEDVVHAVAAHNPATGTTAVSPMDIALLSADQLSGLITAAVLVRPDKDLAGVQIKSLRKRFRETAFARGVDREAIARSAALGLELDEFMEIGLTAMKDAGPTLGL